MAIESERKFLIHEDQFSELAAMSMVMLHTGYFTKPDDPIEIRLQTVGGAGNREIRVCFKHGKGEQRTEFELRSVREHRGPPHATAADAKQMVMRAPAQIIKVRYELPDGWEIDRFDGPASGLWLAEWETSRRGTLLALPPWIREEVTGRQEYSNCAIAWRTWPQSKSENS